MSNLDDVIKDILGNMFYDRSKTISEQIAPDMGGKRERQIQKDTFFDTAPKLGAPINLETNPVTFRGIQPNLDLVISSSNLNRIRVDEYQNITPPFEKPKAEKMFGEWCRALSTGNMVGKSGEDFWFDTTSPALLQCSATTEYYPRSSVNQPGTIDNKFGLKNLIPIYVDYKFDFGPTPEEIEKEKQSRFQKMFEPKKTPKQIKQEEKEKKEKTKKTFKLNANQSLAATLKRNPNWEPRKGWGLYQKGWDCLPGDCSQVGQIVRLPISQTTGKPVYKLYVGANGQQNVCKPLDYDYCLEISWAMINGNSQPNGMKKFTIPSRNPNRQNMGQTFIACSSNMKLENTFEKNSELLYPWQIRYDGYCGSSDGENCSPISVEGEGGKVKTIEGECETSYVEFDVISSLDIRQQTVLTVPGNELPIGIYNYEEELKSKYGTKGCPKCLNIKSSNCGYYDSACKAKEVEKCLDECEKSGENEDMKDEGLVFKSGFVVIGKR